MILPMGIRIASRYGQRIHPITRMKSFHNGIDIVMPIGTTIVAPADGIVEDVYENAIGGLQLLYKCSVEGVTYIFGFAHLSRVVVQKGEAKREGEVIAYSGNSGRSTGAHLHLTTRMNGVLVDPLSVYQRFKLKAL